MMTHEERAIADHEKAIHELGSIIGPRLPRGFDPSQIGPAIAALIALIGDPKVQAFVSVLIRLFGSMTPKPAPAPAPVSPVEPTPLP